MKQSELKMRTHKKNLKSTRRDESPASTQVVGELASQELEMMEQSERQYKTSKFKVTKGNIIEPIMKK